MTIQPVAPDQVVERKQETIPEVVIETFNELIAERWNGHCSTILLREVEAKLVQRGLDRREMFDKHWLDVEPMYRAVGWDVTYDQPAYCESYEAKYEFRKERIGG